MTMYSKPNYTRFKNIGPFGDKPVKDTVWKTSTGSSILFSQLTYDHISNIYWMLSVKDYLFTQFSTNPYSDILFIRKLEQYIKDKFGVKPAPYRPTLADEVHVLRANNLVGDSEIIFLRGQAIGYVPSLHGPTTSVAESEFRRFAGISYGHPTVPVPVVKPAQFQGLTKEYQNYIFHPNIETLNLARIRKIKDYVKNNPERATFPVMVDDENRIVAGVHHFIAMQQLGLPVNIALSLKPLVAKDVKNDKSSAIKAMLEKAGIDISGQDKKEEKKSFTELDNLPKLGKQPGKQIDAVTPVQPKAIPEGVRNFLKAIGDTKNESSGLYKNDPKRTEKKFDNFFKSLQGNVTPTTDSVNISKAVQPVPASVKPTPAKVQERAVLTWAAIKRHFNIGDNMTLNREGLSLINNALRDVYNEGIDDGFIEGTEAVSNHD